MNDNTKTLAMAFFGAANGYNGFKSYFDEIFDSKKFTRIFVIKGGPGTGKSTFMKRVSRHFSNKGDDVEEIYCSSDPSSLDGVIIGRENKKIAFLDGTAPHEMDAKIPGAIYEIINLGDNFDTAKLIKHREKIISLSDKKSAYYKNAYGYLKTAGVAFEFSKAKYEKYFDEPTIEKYASYILSFTTQDEDFEDTTRLISSFSKHGYKTLDTLDQLSDRRIEIPCDRMCAELFLTRLHSTAKKNKISHVAFPSPFSLELTEAVYFIKSRLVVTKCQSDTPSNDFILHKYRDTLKDETEAAIKIEEIAKEEAIKWFNEASKAHFELEKIYFEAVNFEKNDEILEKKIKETEYLLSFDK